MTGFPRSFMALVPILFTLFMSACHPADGDIRPDIPEGAQGVLIISDIKMGRLIALKGMKGQGRYITRNEHGVICEVAPIQFRAGGFQQRGLEMQSDVIVTLGVYSSAVSQRLITGQKIVSTDYLVTLQPGPGSDMVLQAGIDPGDVFILNPRPIWASWLNQSEQQSSCRDVA